MNGYVRKTKSSSNPGDKANLNCDDFWNVHCPDCDATIECVEELQTDGMVQAYWSSTNEQRSLCSGQREIYFNLIKITRDT